MTYQLVALDMDGTLLTSQKTISPRSADALACLAEAGVTLVLATGRSVAELEEYAADLALVRYGVLASGSFSYDFEKGEVVWSQPLEAQDVATIVGITQEAGGVPALSCITEILIRPDDARRMHTIGHGEYQPLYLGIAHKEDDLAAWALSHPGACTKMDLYFPTDESCAKAHDAILAACPLVELHESEPRCLEVTVVGVNKGEGLKALAERVQVSLRQIAAAGDGGNDLPMLELVGLPVAMGNASEEVKAAARVCVANNDQEGISELAELLLKTNAR